MLHNYSFTGAIYIYESQNNGIDTTTTHIIAEKSFKILHMLFPFAFYSKSYSLSALPEHIVIKYILSPFNPHLVLVLQVTTFLMLASTLRLMFL